MARGQERGKIKFSQFLSLLSGVDLRLFPPPLRGRVRVGGDGGGKISSVLSNVNKATLGAKNIFTVFILIVDLKKYKGIMIQNINNKMSQPNFKGRIDGSIPCEVLRDGKTIMESIKLDNLISTPEQDEFVRNILGEINLTKSKSLLTDDLKPKVQVLFDVLGQIIGKPIPFEKDDKTIFMKVKKRANGELKGVTYSKYFPPQEGGSVDLNFSFGDRHLFEKWKR